MRSIYIAGPMRGAEFYNFPAFDAAKERLEKQGWEVVSPADMDRSIDGLNPAQLPADTDWQIFPGGVDFQECVTRDIEAVRSCDAIFMLMGWEHSFGAIAERAVAVWTGKEVIYE